MELQTLEQTLSNSFTVAPGVWGRKDAFVNYYMIQDEESGNWALVDEGFAERLGPGIYRLTNFG